MNRLIRPLPTHDMLALAAYRAGQEVDESDRNIVYKARTEIDFEGVDVSGAVKPQGALLLDRKKAPSILSLTARRINLEMENSVNYIK